MSACLTEPNQTYPCKYYAQLFSNISGHVTEINIYKTIRRKICRFLQYELFKVQ